MGPSNLIIGGQGLLRPGLSLQAISRDIGNRYGHGLGLGSLTDQLDSAIAAAEANRPAEEAAAAASARARRLSELQARYGSTINEVGGIMGEVAALGATVADATTREEIGASMVQGLAIAVNAVAPGLGTMMEAAVRMLWLGASALAHELSDYLHSLQSVGSEIAINKFLHLTGHSTGAVSRQLEQEGLARAYGDRWVIFAHPAWKTGAASTSGYPGSYWNLYRIWETLTNRRSTSGTAGEMIYRATWSALETVAKDLDSRRLSGAIPESDPELVKWIALMRKAFPGAEDRFNAIFGPGYSRSLQVAYYPGGSGGIYNIPTVDTAKNANVIVMWGINVTDVGTLLGGPGRYNIHAFKLPAIPRDMFALIASGVIEQEWDSLPDDYGVRGVLTRARGHSSTNNPPLPQGPVLAAKIIELAATRPSGGGGAGSQKSKQKSKVKPTTSKPWSTGEKVAAGGAAVGAVALITKLLKVW